MKILYIGHTSLQSTSRHRANALKRLGHQVTLADPYIALSNYLRGWLRSAFHYRTGYRFLQHHVLNWLKNSLQEPSHFDIAWVDSGELLGVECIRLLQGAGLTSILYNHDDPTGGRDGRRFDSLLKALPFYGICVVVRHENIQEFKEQGAKNVLKVWRTYDEVAHKPFENAIDIPEGFRSDVAFVGTWIAGERRDLFLLELIRNGVNVAIWGDRWQKAPTWPQLQQYWRGPALAGSDYVAAIQGSKIALGLLSHGNRDLHTTRSSEIPYMGGLLCAERTSEHLEMYREGVDAVFWKDAKECVTVCRQWLADDAGREQIRQQGMARVREKGYGHEAVCREILLQLQTTVKPGALAP